MSKFNNYNSDECKVLKEVFNTMPLMDTNIANIIEEYIYSIVREYYPNGSIKCEYRTKYGEKDGEYKEWFQKNDNSVEDRGQLKNQKNYIEGKLHGEYKRWYENGQLELQTHYVEDKENGEWKYWWCNGQLMIQFHYVDGKKHGEYKFLNKEGILIKDTTYVKGVEVV